MKTKKLVSLALTAMLLLTVAVSAFAAPSPSGNGAVDKITSAADANGHSIEVELKQADPVIIAKARDPETLKAVLVSDYTPNMKVFDVKDVVVPEDTVFPVTLTFTVSGVTGDSKGAFLHYDDSNYEKVVATFGTNTMTGTFNGLSPIAFVVDTTTLAPTDVPTTGNTTPSPDTGDRVMPVLALTGLCLLGAVYAGKKVRG